MLGSSRRDCHRHGVLRTRITGLTTQASYSGEDLIAKRSFQEHTFHDDTQQWIKDGMKKARRGSDRRAGRADGAEGNAGCALPVGAGYGRDTGIPRARSCVLATSRTQGPQGGLVKEEPVASPYVWWQLRDRSQDQRRSRDARLAAHPQTQADIGAGKWAGGNCHRTCGRRQRGSNRCG
jgi:hypothetical protein